MPAIIKTYQRNQVDQTVNPLAVRASQTSLGDLGDGISAVGQMFDGWQDEIDTADAKSADAAYADAIREALYADQTGFMYSNGGDAINRRASVAERLEAEQSRILADLSPAARARAQSAMDARYQRGLQTVDQHAAGQRQVYLDTAATTRVASTVQDAIYSPDLVDQAIATVSQEIADLAARNGEPPEWAALQLRSATTDIHSGILGRLEAVDPSQALEYLRENKDEMSGDVVARWESALVPLVRERAGRAAGARAAQSGAASSYVTYRNSGAVRNDPLSDELVGAMSFLPQMGVRMEVISGGQESEADLRAEGQEQGLTGAALDAFIREHRTGSDRHDHGNSADVDFYLEDGTKLVPSNPDHVAILSEIVRRARDSGVTGFGEGADYMGEGRIHLGFGPAAVWGAGGQAANAPQWLVEAYGNADPLSDLPVVGGGLDSLINIEDPDERAAAIGEYNLRMAAEQSQREGARQAAEDAAFRMIEEGGDINDIPTEYRQHIGREAMNSLRIYQERVASGRPQMTDDATYVVLSEMAAMDPETFMSQDPMTWRSRLNDGDFQYFVKLRSDILSGESSSGSAPNVSALRTAASTALSAAGFGDNDGVKAEFETALLRWTGSFTSANGRAPSPVELNDRINAMLVPMVIDPSGLGNKQSGRAFTMDYDGNPLDPDDDITPGMLRDGALQIRGNAVPNDMIEAYATGYNERFGRAPTVQELVEGIIASGIFE